MSDDRVRAPVAFFTFNRPDTSRRVFDRIRAARPPALFVIADGPRPDHPHDVERCERARRIVEDIDWPCSVERSYAAGNLGLKRRVETGLSWVFERTERAIILEDDCLPDPTFFRFADELLERYQDDDRVMSISGPQFVPAGTEAAASYRFSRQPLIWGWATWRRAWRQYDGAMDGWPARRETGWLRTILGEPRADEYWAYILERNRAAGDRGSWDYAWLLSCWLAGGLSVQPAVNLVTNIGFDADGTHARDPRDPAAGVPARAMAFPLIHPAAVARDEAADRALEGALFSGHLHRLLARVARRVRPS